MNRKLAVVAIGIAGAWCAPIDAQVCTPFTDVAASDPFCGNIQWMHNRGVTLGCTENQYCPTQFVRRDQMAAFMNRLGNVVFEQGGSAFGATAVLGTIDAQPLDLRANNARVMRYEPNAISPNLIGGSAVNDIFEGVRGATIGGGGVPSGADPAFGSVTLNRVTDAYGTVSGGSANLAGNGSGSVIDAPFATVCGGQFNAARGTESTVGGGYANTARGTHSTVGGGNANAATGDASTVAGGALNTASGDHAFAAGYRAKATTTGTFMWADSRDFDFEPSVVNFFGVRATGGAGFTVAIDPTTGAPTQFCNYLPGYSGWSCTSDRDAKENFVAANGEEILAKLVAMPISSWNYKGADRDLRMLGPTAQDFHAAFGLAAADKAIASGNLDGVALAAIQGLNAKLSEQLATRDAAIAAQQREIDGLRTRIAVSEQLRSDVAELKAVLARLASLPPAPPFAIMTGR